MFVRHALLSFAFGRALLGLVRIASFAMLWASASAHAQTILYVNSVASPGGNGSAWNAAFQDLESALAAARAVSSGSVEIWVAGGTYTPSRAIIESDVRTSTFELAASVPMALYGGFNGTEAHLADRPRPLVPTVLSGDLLANDGAGMPGTDNAYHVVYSVTPGTFVIDGFTIRGGNASNTAAPFGILWGWGPALLVDAELTTPVSIFLAISNCVFERNSAAGGCGAVYMNNGTGRTIDRCVFRDNVATGTAVGSTARAAVYWNLVDGEITNCLFVNNTVKAIFARPTQDGAASIRGCTIAFNGVGSPDGLGVDRFSTNARLERSIVWGNGLGTQATQISLTNGSLISYNLIQGWSGSLGGVSNSGQNPLFANASGGAIGDFDDDFLLALNSPAIDSGSASPTVPPTPADLKNNRRVADGDLNGTSVVDRGAFEYRSAPYSPTLFVRANGSVPGDGSSWMSAYGGELGFARALADAAAFPGYFTEVHLSVGVYRPAGPGGSRSLSCQLPPDIAVYGGFAGNEPSRFQRPPPPSNATDALDPAKATILSGDLNSNDIGFSSRGDNSLNVVTIANASNVLLDGVTVTAGSGSATGGGVRITGTDDVTIANSWFIANDAVSGGGVGVSGSSFPLFTNCRFVGNLASDNGGAASITALGSNDPKFDLCHFEGNNALVGGAISFRSPGTYGVARSRFLRNTAAAASNGSAGAIEYAGGTSGKLTVHSCEFLGNSATGGSGALSVSGSASSTAQIANSLFVGNQSPSGGAIVSTGPPISVINSTIVSNVSNEPTYAGGISASSLTLANSILYYNRVASDLGQAGQFVSLGGAQGYIYNTIAGLTSTSGPFATNSAVDPLFVRLPNPGADGLWGSTDDDYGDLRLALGSPAADAADSSLLPVDALNIDGDTDTTENLPVDLARQARQVDDPSVVNTGAGNPNYLDRGAYERQVNCPTCPGRREWQSAIGGSWDNPISWTPSVPDQTHDTRFNLGTSYTVSFPPPPAGPPTRSAKSITIADGSVTLDLNQTILSLTESDLPALAVGAVASEAASLSLTDGELRALDVRVAADPNPANVINTLTVGAGARLVAQATLSVGFQGNGVMNITGGGDVVSRDAIIGEQAGSSGYVSVSGVGSTWDIPFFLIIDNGELNVSNAGAVNVGTGIPFTGIFLLNDGRISGNGTINGNIVNFGRIAPGNSPGTLTINGGYAQVGEIQDLGQFSGRLDMEIAGTAPGQFDKLDIRGGGEVVLGGGMFVNFAPGFQPAPGDAFEMIAAQGPIGAVGTNTGRQFDVIFFPALTAPNVQSKFLRASYSGLRGPGNGVTVSVADLPINAGFNPPASTSLTTAPEGAAIGDLDADGDLDIAIALPASGSVNGSIALLLNNGAGGFAVSQISSGGIEPRGVAIANIDNANGNDLAIANAGSDQVRVLRRQPGPAGTANFGDPAPITIQLATGSRPIAIAARDLDRPTASDTIDLMTANEGGGGDATGSISVMRNVGGSTPFQTTPTTSAPTKPNTRPTNIRPFNPNQDKDLDVAVTTVSTGGAGALMIFSNVGSQGIFSPGAPNVAIPIDAGPVEIAAGVLSPGGASIPGTAQDEDLVIVNRAGQSVSVLRNTGTFDEVNPEAEPGFAPAVSYTIASGTTGLSSDPRSIVLSDIDNDGDLDIAAIATATPTQRVIKVLRNDSTTQSVPGVGTVRQVAFAQIADRTSGDCPRQVLAGDVTGDGRADLVTVNTTCDRGPLLGSVSLNSNTLPPLSVSVGACCAPASSGGTCELLTQAECLNRGHAFQGAQVACGPTLCPQPAAACCRGSTCVVLDSVACLSVSHSRYAGAGTVCNAQGNATTPCCRADYNQSSMVSVQDIFDFLSGWFAGDFAKANFNGDTSLSVQDLFDFLAAWFAGC